LEKEKRVWKVPLLIFLCLFKSKFSSAKVKKK
jgi:hypothetical protein